MRSNKHYSLAMLILIVFSCLVIARTTTAATIEGFRGICWGEPFSKYKSVMIPIGLTSRYPSESCYRLDDHPTFAGIYVGPITYEFDEKGFWNASFIIHYGYQAKTKEDTLKSSKSLFEFESKISKMLSACEKQWGPPIEGITPMPGEEETIEYEWITTEAVARLSYTTNSQEGKLYKKKPFGILMFSVESIAGRARMDEWRKQQKIDF